MSSPMPPDNLNEIGVLKRREIEARVLMPVLEALGAQYGREQVFALEDWKKGDAYRMDVIERRPSKQPSA